MDNKEKRELMKECTSEMSIEIDNIPKEKCMEISELIGNILMAFELEFIYGGIVEGISNKICGVQFDIKNKM